MGEAVLLSDATLAALPASVRRPEYDRAKLTPGIVHIGLGNFHRAHQAWYLHRLMQEGKAHDWGILGAGVRPADAAMRARLLAQDCLTTLIELDPGGISAKVCGAMIGFIPVEPANGALIAQMADPAIRIVSLTVTEGGYYQDPATGAFDPSHPDIAHDAANPDTPRTAFGAIVAALSLRRARGVLPFTGQSCDNLQGNGDVLRATVTGLARLSDPGLADWIEAEGGFPNAMVDCIVPATGPEELALAQSLGIADAAPVTHENFRQWVIEEHFVSGRPPWEEAGATITDDVHAYETMKIRILNGGHQVIADPAEVLGIATIADAMAHSGISGFLRKVVRDEIAPHVAPVPGMTPEAYLDQIATRFANPRIRDTTRRVAFDGSSRHAGFLVPSIRDGLASGANVDGLALASAAWARYCTGIREDGSAVEPNDPDWTKLQARAIAAQEDPMAWLGMRHIYGDLAEAPRFATAFANWMAMIRRQGIDAALTHYTGG
ncbi:MAG: mannitol dehydrogenase family protein [Pseudomonadota bacterium]